MSEHEHGDGGRSGLGRWRSSDQTLRRIGWTLSSLSILSAPTTMILVARAGALDKMFSHFSFVDALNAFCYGALGLVLIKSQPRNRLVWFFVAVGMCGAVAGTITGVVELLAGDQGVSYGQVDLSGWPPGLAIVVAHAHAVWVLANFGLPTLGLLLAPDGRLLSRRWLPVALAAGLAIAVLWLSFAAAWPLLSAEAMESHSGWVLGVVLASFLAVLVLIIVSFVSLVQRYRRSDGATKRRLRWVLFGGGLFVVAFFPASLGPPALLAGFYPILALSFGLAIWRDQPPPCGWWPGRTGRTATVSQRRTQGSSASCSRLVSPCSCSRSSSRSCRCCSGIDAPTARHGADFAGCSSEVPSSHSRGSR